jgi:hypothetical protein
MSFNDFIISDVGRVSPSSTNITIISIQNIVISGLIIPLEPAKLG